MPYTLHETLANVFGDVQVFLLHGSVAQVASLKLIGLVRRELFNRQGKLSVVLERLDEVAVKGSATSAVSLPSPSSTNHPETRWP